MNNIHKYRKLKRLTQAELATLVQCNKAYISELENGNIREPSLGRARLISYYLDADLDDVFPNNRSKNK